MNNDDIAAHYARLLADHGPTFRAGDHGSEASQVRRFRALAGVWGSTDYAHLSLLDVGCGTAEFAFWWPGQYEGWDICSPVIEEARQNISEEDTCRVRDLMDSTETDAFDYVVASGLFQFRDGEYLSAAVLRMFDLCRKAVAFNFLTRPDGTPGETAFSALDVLRFCRTLSPRLVLRTDYLPNDATVYLYKEPCAPSS